MKSKLIGILSACFVFATSCSKSAQIVLFNNSGSALQLNFGNGWRDLGSGSTLRFAPSYSDDVAFLIAVPKRQLRYQIAGLPIPQKFVSWTNGHSHIFLQLQSDLKHYIVEPGAKFPVLSLPTQPEGFPIAPKPEQ